MAIIEGASVGGYNDETKVIDYTAPSSGQGASSHGYHAKRNIGVSVEKVAPIKLGAAPRRYSAELAVLFSSDDF